MGVVMEVVMEGVMEVVMGLDMTTVLILSTSSMGSMMTNITQTSVKKDMVTQLVLSWRSHMMERPTILMLFTMEVMVIMDMEELEGDMDLLDKIHIDFPGPGHTVKLSLLVLVNIF